jgi:catechol 2,3-dioxygenase-like lactoylglutathione lyase family enzyme
MRSDISPEAEEAVHETRGGYQMSSQAVQEDRGMHHAVPIKLAHVVLRTSRFAELVKWYMDVLGAVPAFQNEGIAFLRYDDEHHRVAIINVPEMADPPGGIAGVHHVAFTFGSLGDLLDTYDRLHAQGVDPIFCTNHGPTTSIYYADPDGNQIELQVDNFDTVEEANRFFASPEFNQNPIGVDFDPGELSRQLRQGVPEATLKVRPPSGPRGITEMPLR